MPTDTPPPKEPGRDTNSTNKKQRKGEKLIESFGNHYMEFIIRLVSTLAVKHRKCEVVRI